MNIDFQKNLDYILKHLEEDIFKANNLSDKVYMEMTKNEVIESLKYVYQNIKSWEDNYNNRKYEDIIDKYGELQSIISQLELCLADYEKQFHMDGISYSVFQIGKILSNIMKGSDKSAG